ncbi:flavodoxin-dependent (E)-4-hydroxy-3-methylbut-2-enyl-diphosphate synthase [Iamia sp. SCSIO 61187]|uniref:flavodoxin-dependent (E)-4-hydroxy-3-methylbut-2-enyl-diphosphate synthase n=1 Tax=Iamia sp. SCSIO 61187 TaxID=2722752 RepID=UPI001C62D1C5|nr:flavodoxin-dependent (E)-4-hydroxy-3-methylbut-2-enyl-diphosphate synthase [Iamia sp. SCSIO 61187]QYG91062.1 flavodoxin-dependent (E)-4-hydroxy-3-methylbut-2-enyl-diphosphate synthase [Iamia sp. SCSIO 61187]
MRLKSTLWHNTRAARNLVKALRQNAAGSCPTCGRAVDPKPTQADLGEATANLTGYGRWERGDEDLRADEMARVAMSLAVGPGELARMAKRVERGEDPAAVADRRKARVEGRRRDVSEYPWARWERTEYSWTYKPRR